MHWSLENIHQLKKKRVVEKAREIVLEDVGQRIPGIYSTKVYAKDSFIIVLFDLPIKFARENSVNYYSASVDLISGSTTYQPIVNTEKEVDASEHFPFYQPNKSDKKWIDFVLSSKGMSSNDFIDSQQKLTIIEKDNSFDVKILSLSQSIRFKMDKKTGAISDTSHRQIKTESLEQQGYSEIKE